tara:strand:+ start:39 stop:1436 length:1398 start_codon:yes stop_codon:yes gene_type:complete
VAHKIDIVPPSRSVSSMFERRNVWSDWFPHDWVSPLSWVKMTAILLHDTMPEAIVDRLAPLVEETREATELRIRELAKAAPVDAKVLVTYDDYREFFQDELLERYDAFLETLDGGPDLEWLRDRLLRNGAGAQSFVWFLLNGIAQAQIEEILDEKEIAPGARWLAELEFHEPAFLAGDEVVLREFYHAFRESFPAAAPLPARPSTYPRLAHPIFADEDPYIARLKVIEERQARQLACEHITPADGTKLPEDAWRRASNRNAWFRALDLARVPAFHWQRQVAFLLRDVSLDEGAVRVERALLDMAEITARHAIADAMARDRAVEDIGFGLWFKWWREHFRHWNDPLRAELLELCSPDDASLVGDWLPRFEPAVFADFLVTCSHAYAIGDRIGLGTFCGKERRFELFVGETNRPLATWNLFDVTLELWKRFCTSEGIADHGDHRALDFEVDWNVPLSCGQPGPGIRI